MKTFIVSSIVAVLALVGAAPKAEARPGYPSTRIVVTGYTSWGAPIRAERYFIRYNRHGEIIWGYRRLPVARPYCPPPRPYCPPSRPYYGGGGYYRDRGCR